MAKARVVLDSSIYDGIPVTFKAPCDCTRVDGLRVYYTEVTEESSVPASKDFVFKDAHGNTLTGIGNLFSEGAYVRVILDTTNGYAYIQNADTNGYLENKIHPVGSVYVTSTTTNPSSELGGTWELIDKEFSSKSGMDAYGDVGIDSEYVDSVNNCQDRISNPQVSYARGGHSIYVRFTFTTAEELNISDLAYGGRTCLFGRFLLDKLGISTVTFAKNLVGNFYINGNKCGTFRVFTYNTNNFAITGVDNSTNGVIPAGVACNVEFTETALKETMLDSACDKFYWKRTA